jgi:hypothetical protein
LSQEVVLVSQPGSSTSLNAYPNITEASKMLGVSASTLSRRGDLAGEPRGERDVVLAPGEVLRLGAIYRKRSLNDVAEALLDFAERADPQERRIVEAELEAYFAGHTVAGERQELLRRARRLLDQEGVAELEAILARAPDPLPDMIEGYVPIAEED